MVNHVRKPKMVLVACSGEETAQLAEDISGKLRDDYGLEGLVEVVQSARRREISKETLKGYTHPLVGDYFSDQEVQVDIGANFLRDDIQGKHVVLIEHLLTPGRISNGNCPVSVNDHHMTIRGFLNLLANAQVPTITLAVPYLIYVRAHSVKKYRLRGFEQFDSLPIVLEDYRKGGVNNIITIDPHSEYAARLVEDLGMTFRSINPFQSARAINPAKLGLSGEKAQRILKSLRPFQEMLAQMMSDHLYIVSVDDGTEKRAENVIERLFNTVEDLEAVYSRLLYLEKDRISYEGKVVKFKHFSSQKEHNIDPEGTYILIDDMVASATTVFDVARMLKHPHTGQSGAKVVEAWTTHAVTMPHQYNTVNNGVGNCVNRIVCLDTVPQPGALNITRVKASADLLAAEIYKVYERSRCKLAA